MHSNSVKKKILAIFLGSILLCIIFLLLPIWNVSNIHVEGNKYYTKEAILQAANIKEGMHILEIGKNKASHKMEDLPYIKEAQVNYTFPRTLTIKVTECTPIGYVPFLGTYLCLDKQGQVLEQVTKPTLKLPILQGLKFQKLVMNEKIAFENEDKFLALAEMVEILKKYNYAAKIDSIDISNIEQIHLYVNKLDVIIGNIRDFDKKIEWLIQVDKDYSMGILDLSLITQGQAILTPLT